MHEGVVYSGIVELNVSVLCRRGTLAGRECKQGLGLSLCNLLSEVSFAVALCY